ncbi:MAG: 4-(cytidine 5'-diphospho)-2-C-methyl-D-erythritol kinase [Geminicoccaceae bacterium]
MAELRELARAKLNLDLLVLSRRADGYHELDSLVAFAELADELTFAPSDRLEREATGPFAGELPAPTDDLVLRAAELLRAETGVQAGAKIGIVKRLPIAAGIGGGSADAAATLRGLNRLWGLDLGHQDLARIGVRLGADLPVCIRSRATHMTGIGEVLAPLAEVPSYDLLLVNPRHQLPTGPVFKALRLPTAGGRKDEIGSMPLLDLLVRSRNDLEAPAKAQLPKIDEVLAAIADLPGCRLARVSGSGATCFGLFGDGTSAAQAEGALAAAHPEWWVARSRLAA